MATKCSVEIGPREAGAQPGEGVPAAARRHGVDDVVDLVAQKPLDVEHGTEMLRYRARPAEVPVLAVDGVTVTLNFEGGGPPAFPVLGNDSRLGQVIDNLVSNALKFTPAGGTVEVRAYPHASAVRIEVADTGMGISEDEQAQLFERFFRTARAQEEAIPGVGLGLSISKAIVEAHNGRISVRSVEGVGTTFFVDLPAIAKGIRIVSAA